MSTLPRLARHNRIQRNQCRTLGTSIQKDGPSTTPSIPSIPTCPPSGCPCAAMPEGLAIDHGRNMNGSMPPYAQHVIIKTGRSNWSSKIEDEPHTLGEQIGGGNLARDLKALLGRGGSLHDVSKSATRLESGCWGDLRGTLLANSMRFSLALMAYPHHKQLRSPLRAQEFPQRCSHNA